MTDNLVNQIEITIHCIGTQNHQKDNQLRRHSISFSLVSVRLMVIVSMLLLHLTMLLLCHHLLMLLHSDLLLLRLRILWTPSQDPGHLLTSPPILLLGLL